MLPREYLTGQLAPDGKVRCPAASVCGQIDHSRQARANRVGHLADQVRGDRGVHGQHNEGVATLSVPAHLHLADVDVVAAQDLADRADNTGPVNWTSRSFCRSPDSVPLTDTSWPSGAVPRIVSRFRQS